MDGRLTLSVVMGSYNRKRYLINAVRSVRYEIESFYIDSEIIVIDGGSTDGSIEWLIKQKDIISIVQHNRGVWNGKEVERRSWGYFMNLGFKCAQGKFICMLSDDCLVVPGAIRNGIQVFESALSGGGDVGALAFYWRNFPEQQSYWVGSTLGEKLSVNHGLFLKSALEKVGYVDENSFRFYHADSDLCLKLWEAGYSIVPSPDSYIEHFSHANIKARKTNKENQREDWLAFLDKWKYVYYDPEVNNVGSWHYKQYFDKHKTVEKFKSLYRLRRWLSRLFFKTV